MVSTMRISAFIAICLIGFVSVCDAQIKLKGKCPKVSVIPNFNAKAYMGRWYEAAKFPAAFETGGSCTYANYTLLSNGTVGVVNGQKSEYFGNTEIKGNAVVVENAKLLVNFPSVPAPVQKKGSNYWVLDTDYKNYSVVFSCQQTGFAFHTNTQFVWILTRQRTPSIQTFLDAMKVLTKNKISLDHLTVTNQQGCY